MTILGSIDRPDEKPRDPPHNLEAEQEVLGAALIDNEAGAELLAVARPDDFYHPAHSLIAQTILQVIDRGRLADPLTIAGYLAEESTLAQVGGAQPYLVGLTQALSSRITAPAYARVVRDLATRRRAIEVGRRLIDAAHSQEVDAEAREIVTAADGELVALLDGADDSADAGMAETLDATLDAAEAQHQGKAVFRLPTGLKPLDDIIGGLPRGGYTVLGGRPSMGKTALALQIAYNVARSGQGVAFFSMEMPKRDLGARWLAAVTGIPSDRIDQGRLSPDEWKQLHVARQEMRDLPIRIDDRRALSPADIRARLAGMRRRLSVPLGLVVVDYLQLMKPPRSMPNNTVREMTEISNGLAAMFGAMDCAGLVLSQLSRRVEERNDKRPQLADLRESGAIEQDADMAMFCYRDAYYLLRNSPGPDAGQAKWNEWRAAIEAVEHDLEVIIPKNRRGRIGTAALYYHLESQLIGDPATTIHRDSPVQSAFEM